MTKPDIQIFIQTHKPVYIPEHPMLQALQIGAASNPPIAGMIADNTGDHISEKNSSYCEMTGQYWVWKNLCCKENAPEYVGFFHYRRYLRFTAQKHPYDILSQPDENILQQMGYDPDHMREHISRYDIVAPVPEEMYESAWDNYRRAPDHFPEDLLLVSRIVTEMYPSYVQAMMDYLNGSRFYLKNMYIMKSEIFDAYCSWLFSVLDEFDRRNDTGKYNNDRAAKRVNGYLAERLFGIWLTRQKQLGIYVIGEFPRVHFAELDGGKGNLKKMRLVNMVLPSGTRRRSLVSRGARFVLKQKANRKYR